VYDKTPSFFPPFPGAKTDGVPFLAKIKRGLFFQTKKEVAHHSHMLSYGGITRIRFKGSAFAISAIGSAPLCYSVIATV
jgi:purine-nucleoside phosphorylase